MAQKPSIPKGTRDFTPAEMIKRNYIFDTIRSVYKLFGYLPIETPAMETMQTLMGKYGEEGDRLIFKILNSGEFQQAITAQDLEQKSSAALANQLCEKALRYDLTVPFARFVVMHRNEIQLPFKRYQIQPVWRADRPQRGRYREFFQCDADIVGSDSLLNEYELIQIIDMVFSRFGIGITIKLNNRKILSGIAEIIGEPDKITDITVAIDKYEKIGIENVNKELLEKGIAPEKIAVLQPIIELQGSNDEKLEKLATILAQSPVGVEGILELRYVFSLLQCVTLQACVEVDLTLARGLNYYTGAIFEVKANDVHIGSICGGGRYDNLTGIFGMQGISGVGISFGADRIFDVLNQLDAYPETTKQTTQVLFINFGEKEQRAILPMLTKLRAHNISCELYPESGKMKKQMQYANDRAIPFVALVGESEMQNNTLTLKNMQTGEQKNVSLHECIECVARV
ncbi:MAG: histidine--tRNA ligase [Bacteroidales bacterium]|jgi:histidyl-tRNA synthetase|nr:histidine--tRNA ligase [Bacteroidales bacterium]